MPSLKDHHSAQSTKMLVIGDSGSGKSGALASLANAGYKLRIIDLDNGIDVLANLLKNPSSGYKPDALDRVDYETLTDPMKNVGGRLVPSKATVWNRLVGLLTNWPTFGSITTWDQDTVLVIDSLTMASTAAMNFILSMNARLGQQPHQSDWYAAQQLVEGMLQGLYDEGVKCNVIINCHVTYIGEDNGPQHGYPASLGKALPPKTGRYFNTMIQARTVGSGSAAKRKLFTAPTSMIELKTSNPVVVKPDYPIETGLAEIFSALRSGKGPGTPAK